MFSRFFIDRPIFASVLSILVTLGGSIAVFGLPVAQYPDIAPPTVEVSGFYPGANAQVVADTVAAPIEQQVNGVENMLYMSSQCTNDGTYTLTVTFKLGTDLNIAQVLVQNRVSLAQPILPDLVQRRGISVKKKSPSQLMIVNLYSPNGTRDSLDLSNYATIQLRDELARLPGVGDVTYLGQRDYSMRIWLDPQKMASRNLSVQDVLASIGQQNAQVAAGQIGQPPVDRGQINQYTMTTLGRLTTPEEFQAITLKTGSNSQLVYLRDVARVELGAQTYDQTSTLDGRPSVALSIYQLPGSNALKTAKVVRDRMEELKVRFPSDIDFQIVYDTTPFITESISEVFQTLRDAIILVAIVVLVFLQSWRSTLIPLIAVPVAVVGTFAVMAVLGFSLNNLTLFGLVLAIGIVVDDAIVVVEAVEHHIEHGMDPRSATALALEQVSGPVVAVALVLSAVFVPCAFISGITGQFFRQFALTIAVSTILSAFNSLTLSPALCALLLKPRSETRAAAVGHGHTHEGNGHTHEGNGAAASEQESHDLEVPEPPKEVLPWWAYGLVGGFLAYSFLIGPVFGLHAHGWEFYLGMTTLQGAGLLASGAVLGALLYTPLNAVLHWSFRLFNFGFTRATSVYTRSVGLMLRGSVIVLVVYGGLIALTWWSFTTTPSGFIPQQDKGFLLVNVRLPDGASVARTRQTMQRIEDIARFEVEAEPIERKPAPPLGGSWSEEQRAAQDQLWMDRCYHLLDDQTVRGDAIYRKKKRPGVNHTVAVSGQSLLLNANAPNFGSMYVMLDPFEERLKPELSADGLANLLRKEFGREVQAEVGVYGAPPVEGLGTAGGFKIVIENRGNAPAETLQAVAESVVERGNQSGELEGMFTSNRANTPWVFLDIDRLQAAAKHVSFAEVAGSLQVYYGGFYVNDFNKFGRTWQVNVQAEQSFRGRLEDLKQLKGRSTPDPSKPGDTGSMVPLAGLGKAKGINGPVMVVRYNMYPAAIINGNGSPGVSSGDAILRTEETVKQDLPRSMRFEWTELALLQLETGNTAFLVFVLAVALVFLVLAAQYESWSLPLAVILVVPMCLLCSIVGVVYFDSTMNFLSEKSGLAWLQRPTGNSDINIFTQIGFVVLVGLACKNAILIVEFAKAQRERGVPRRQATLAACRLRLRPILMTSFAFILGVVPLVVAEGAGAEMRQTLGTAVFFGMLGVTLFGIFLTPVFYYVIQWFTDLRMRNRTPENLPLSAGHGPSHPTGSGVYAGVGH